MCQVHALQKLNAFLNGIGTECVSVGLLSFMQGCASSIDDYAKDGGPGAV